MHKKYQFPLYLYIIFENLEPLVYTNDKLSANHYIALIPNEEIFNISCVLKNEVFFGFNFLCEISAIDTLKYSKFLPDLDLLFNKNRIILFYIFYFYMLKVRITFFSFVNSKINRVVSIENNFLNANWLEREVSEMFFINFIFKKDNRNLLLDYSQNEHPMLKDFPTEGHKDLYYSFLEESLVYINHNYIEL
jgi:NADH-quinone oxidoreductase subunit C